MSKHTPGQMAEREAEVRTDCARRPNEDVGALLGILDAERETKAELLEALEEVTDWLELAGTYAREMRDARVDAVLERARAAIAKAEPQPTRRPDFMRVQPDSDGLVLVPEEKADHCELCDVTLADIESFDATTNAAVPGYWVCAHCHARATGKKP